MVRALVEFEYYNRGKDDYETDFQDNPVLLPSVILLYHGMSRIKPQSRIVNLLAPTSSNNQDHKVRVFVRDRKHLKWFR